MLQNKHVQDAADAEYFKPMSGVVITQLAKKILVALKQACNLSKADCNLIFHEFQKAEREERERRERQREETERESRSDILLALYNARCIIINNDTGN